MDLDELIDPLAARLRRIADAYAPAAFACEFGAEDLVLLDQIVRQDLAIEVFMLDTGRLPEETHRLRQCVERTYGLHLRVLLPDARAVERHLERHGADAFYTDAALRRRCCAIRRREPLRRALHGKRAWITACRREQVADPAALGLQQFDRAHGIERFNPLADWTLSQVWVYLREFQIPCHPLYERGYLGIGCAPCTGPARAEPDPMRVPQHSTAQAPGREAHRPPVPTGDWRLP